MLVNQYNSSKDVPSSLLLWTWCLVIILATLDGSTHSLAMNATEGVLSSAASSKERSSKSGGSILDDAWNASAVKGAKILIFPPLLHDSHVFMFNALAGGLQREGVETTLLLGEGRNVSVKTRHHSVRTFKSLLDPSLRAEFVEQRARNVLNGYPTFVELFSIIDLYVRNCDALFSGDRSTVEQLRNDNYTMMIVDPNELCGFIIARYLELPVIVFSTGIWVPHEIQMPSPPSYVPAFNSPFSDRMGLLERTANLLMYIIQDIGIRLLVYPMYDSIIRRHSIAGPPKITNPRRLRLAPGAPPPNPEGCGISDIARNSHSWILCTDLALEFPRPLMPHVEYSGGILNHPAEPLSGDLKAWADQGPFVIVSFGSVLHNLSDHLSTIFTDALSSVPYRVIWKYSRHVENPPGNNVYVVDWLPQGDLLAHPNAKAFVGHGGANGVYECLYHAVPVLGIPIMGDMHDAMSRVSAKGLGRTLPWRRLTAEKLKDAVIDVVTNPIYRDNMKLFSSILKNQRDGPLERAVNRITYTMRYGGAPHFRPQSLRLNIMQYYHLDSILLIVIAIGCAFYLVWRVATAIVLLLFRLVAARLPLTAAQVKRKYIPLRSKQDALEGIGSSEEGRALSPRPGVYRAGGRSKLRRVFSVLWHGISGFGTRPAEAIHDGPESTTAVSRDVEIGSVTGPRSLGPPDLAGRVAWGEMSNATDDELRNSHGVAFPGDNEEIDDRVMTRRVECNAVDTTWEQSDAAITVDMYDDGTGPILTTSTTAIPSSNNGVTCGPLRNPVGTGDEGPNFWNRFGTGWPDETLATIDDGGVSSIDTQEPANSTNQ